MSDSEKESVKKGIKDGLEGLKGKIPGLIDIKVLSVYHVYLEFRSRSVLESVFEGLKEQNIKVRSLEITRTREKEVMNSSAIFTLRFQKAVPANEVLERIRAIDGVYLVEEL